MITQDKVKEYIWAGGDIDGYARSGRHSDITDADWFLIDQTISAIGMIRRGQAAQSLKADALFIKLVSSLPFVQGGGFLGVTWRRALVASLLGNTASFFIGVLASGTPWIDHDTRLGGVE